MNLTWMLALVLAIAVSLTAVAVAAAEKPTVVQAGNVILTFNSSISPKKLPKQQFAPIAFHASGTIATTDGSQPPALREVVVDAYKGAEVDVSGQPVCSEGKLRAEDTKQAEAACPGAILGRGTTTVRVAFPESTPFEATGPLLYFNGGSRGGVTTLYIQAYVAVPAPTAIVSTVRITKEDKGPYGLHLVGSIPPIAGGSGSVISFAFGFPRSVGYGAKNHSYLLARCATGLLYARVQTIFSDGTDVTGNVVRTCKQEG
ncbi:MAG: hypothetical protein WB507_14095 [Solirubrobacterales bacterium]